MRIPNLPVVPYLPPGDPELGREVEKRIVGTPAVLLRNHGSIAVGATLSRSCRARRRDRRSCPALFHSGRPWTGAFLRTGSRTSEAIRLARCLSLSRRLPMTIPERLIWRECSPNEACAPFCCSISPRRKSFERRTKDADAVVIGTASRSIDPAEAYRRTREAVEAAQIGDPEVLRNQVLQYVRFHAEPATSVQSIDAAMDETGAEFTVALPALPVNGRTTYMGYHFVGRQLLSDSSMRHHPLNPMTELESGEASAISDEAPRWSARVSLCSRRNRAGTRPPERTED